MASEPFVPKIVTLRETNLRQVEQTLMNAAADAVAGTFGQVESFALVLVGAKGVPHTFYAGPGSASSEFIALLELGKAVMDDLLRVVDAALASLQPVTQAQALLDAATGKTPHVFNGLCPDSIEGPDVRDPDCPACQALLGVTQAKSEAVALLPCPNSFVCAGRCDNRCEEGFAPAAIEKQTHFCQAWGSCDYCAICGKAMPVPTGPVAAPQEAVERQPLTEQWIISKAQQNGWDGQDGAPPWFVEVVRDVEAAHGIGPATQEEA